MGTGTTIPPEKLFFRIGEVCELIKVQPHVLRYWETEFPMLTPQKNPAGQRVYRRKDVEMVMRIRNLLYEEKFTIAGAKKKLLDEMRGGAAKARVPARTAAPAPEPEPEPVMEAPEPPPVPPPVETTAVETPASAQAPATEQTLSPQVRRALRVLRRDLEDLLTMLNADVSIKR
ncbi:MAG TPA: MerR family transcriptional regulator [Blastocatellia bacterium]|nr:MerR family transcriptional regulator [Blastocatellia bacterium]